MSCDGKVFVQGVEGFLKTKKNYSKEANKHSELKVYRI